MNNYVDTTEITHISLCSGYGGIDLGLRRVIPNLRTVAYSEIEAFACELLLARMESGQLDAAPIWSDLKTFPWSEFSGKVDILSGGYPCEIKNTYGRWMPYSATARYRAEAFLKTLGKWEEAE
jgi:hypothetical protein